MPRRRQKNPLLGRILGISLLAHVIALPVLAKFGAFKKIQQQFIEARLITLPPAVSEKKPPEVKKNPQPHKPAHTARKGKTTTPHTHQAAAKSNLNQPKVVASNGNTPGGAVDGEPTVDANGSGTAGQLPSQKTDITPPTIKAPDPEPEKKPSITEPKPQPLPRTEPKPAPEVEEQKPVPVPSKPALLTEADATFSPQPTLPDELRSEALDKTFIAEFVVGVDGKPNTVKVAQSTGNDELDRLALETAKKWRFKPATRDGQPIESRVRLHIEFTVS